MQIKTDGALHTDLLEKQFGPIHISVIRHDRSGDRIREAKLLDTKNILRTYAITLLEYDANDPEIGGIDEEIRLGGLIGKTFRSHGYAIKRNAIDSFEISLPLWLQKEFMTSKTIAQVKLTECYVGKEGDALHRYGTLMEISHPDFIETAQFQTYNSRPNLRKKFIGLIPSA